MRIRLWVARDKAFALRIVDQPPAPTAAVLFQYYRYRITYTVYSFEILRNKIGNLRIIALQN